MKYIVVTFEVQREGEMFAARCVELNAASCGQTLDEARANVLDATTCWLETCVELGECERFFRQRGVQVYDAPPALPEVACAPGECRWAQALPVPDTVCP